MALVSGEHSHSASLLIFMASSWGRSAIACFRGTLTLLFQGHTFSFVSGHIYSCETGQTCSSVSGHTYSSETGQTWALLKKGRLAPLIYGTLTLFHSQQNTRAGRGSNAVLGKGPGVQCQTCRRPFAVNLGS